MTLVKPKDACKLSLFYLSTDVAIYLMGAASRKSTWSLMLTVNKHLAFTDHASFSVFHLQQFINFHFMPMAINNPEVAE